MTIHLPVPHRRGLAAVLAGALLFTGCSSSNDAAAPTTAERSEHGFRVDGVSTALTRVTGGDVVVAVEGTAEVATFQLDGATLDASVVAPGSGTLIDDENRTLYLISGLDEGDNDVTVRAGDESQSITIVNHPISGPVFSGPHLPMPTCTTDDFGLGPATGEDCFAEPSLRRAYFTADRTLSDLGADEVVPSDAYRDERGNAVEVEVETGVINRGVYEIMTPVSTEWNGRLVYRFGGGCGVTYSQGFIMANDPDLELFERGYAVATSTLNTFQVTCNDVISAETAMMVKEHFVESHGEIAVTIGEGGSGGAIQQLLITQNYPGILDAIAPTMPFPDAVTISGGVLDCALLNDYYRRAGAELTAQQHTAINGHMTEGTCSFWEETFAPAVNPTTCGFGDIVNSAAAAIPGLGDAEFPRPPAEAIWNADSNPDGVRCTLQDGNVNELGIDDDTGFARRPWDNVGVQYGLSALNEGAIDVDEFLDLNSGVGSFDINGNIVASRAAIDAETAAVAYRSGRVLGSLQPHMMAVPTILVNIYTDPTGDIHDRIRMFSIDERLQLDGHQAPNVALWTRSVPPGAGLVESLSGSIGFGIQLVSTLDEWATALKSSSKQVDAAALEASRPAAAVNSCFTADATLIDSGDDIYDVAGPCRDDFQIFGDSRIVAGAPLRSDIVKCSLQTLDSATTAGVWAVEFTDEQRKRLGEVFPDGVCDWSAPGVGQEPNDGPWQDFS